ncbi:hypothetical protein NC652_000518 [Populus alba x Populus x berolinensis]|nr:hypothetical protein NC652_000518 [Populus alba x Populus x berolinensis]
MEESQLERNPRNGFLALVLRPINWLKMLGEELHWSFVLGVMIVYGISQGFAVGMSKVSTMYYMKDEQKVQPSELQVYLGLLQLPWVIKPLWGLLTDTLPVLGYRRRPYFIFSGFLSVTSMLALSIQRNLSLAFSLLSLMGVSAGIAIAVVAIDACVTQNSISHPSLAGDMQSLCGFSSSIGALVGYSLSGFLVHLVGPKAHVDSIPSAARLYCFFSSFYPLHNLSGVTLTSQGVFGLLSVPAGLVILVGMMLKESRVHKFTHRGVNEKFLDAGKAMWTALKFRDVWRPCLYMYLSLAVSLNIHEGMFYWYTDAKGGPSFSQLNRFAMCTHLEPQHGLFASKNSNLSLITYHEISSWLNSDSELGCSDVLFWYGMQEVVGSIFSVGAVGSLSGVLIYQNWLKDHRFRDLLFWSQLLYGASGLLDLILVLRLNLKIGLPDYFFVVIDEAISMMIGRIKWQPLLVLSSKLCPAGIEGTFFALLMSIDHVGLLSSTWVGGLLLKFLKVTRTQFDNLWVAILIRSLMRIIPVFLLFLIPRSDPNLSILPEEMLKMKKGDYTLESENTEMVSLVGST